MAPLGRNCESTVVLTAVVSALNKGTTAALFLVRVLAVYPRNRFVQAMFTTLWCAVVGGSIGLIPTMSGVELVPTQYCTFLPTSLWKTMSLFMASVDSIFDILVCSAIEYQMRQYWVGGGETDERQSWFCFPARRNSKLADRFMRDSQTYVS